MAYTTKNKAHSNHTLIKPDGSIISQYSRYETGRIQGRYRAIPAAIADSTGFDGASFDSTVGSVDDSWHVFNVFDAANGYIDSMAIGGAMDSDHALQIAKTQMDSLGGTHYKLIANNAVQFDGIDHDHTWSIDAISKLMDNPSQNKDYLPIITAPELVAEAERVTFDSVAWDSNDNLMSHEGKASRLYLDLTRADSRNELVTEFDLADALFVMDAQEAGFDALMDTKSRLPLLKDRLFKALSRISSDSLSVINVTQTKEFKRQGVINIAFVFDLSDGQKLSIWFHKPLESSSKLLPSDFMVSWKWMLNKRDVTAALSPKQGEDVQLEPLARRIMIVAAKNSKRFKAAQARKAKTEQELLDAQQALEDKKATIEKLDADIADLNAKIDAAMQARKVDEREQPLKTTTETTTDENGVVKTVVRDADGNIVSSSIDNSGVIDQPASIDDGKDSNTAPISITGQEIDVNEGMDFKTAKNNAMAYFDKNLRDKVIFCPAIDSDVILRRRGGKHIAKANNTFREKLQLVAAIPEMIKKGKYGHYTAASKGKNPNIEGYYVLQVNVAIDDVLKNARVVLEKNNEGEVLYDIGINKKEALAALGDTDTNAMFDGFSGSSQYQGLAKSYQDEGDSVKQFDKLSTNGVAAADLVLNIFFDEDLELTSETTADEAETTVSVYINSRGRVLATVTEQAGKYHVKGENFSGGNYPDDASVLKQLKVVKENNPSMKLKEGKEFFSIDDAGKIYPPVERGDNGTYVAYMNSKKKDSWLAIPKPDGSFTVYADNAQTRAYRTSTPKMFTDVQELLVAYPAFKGIEALIAEDQDDNEVDSSEYPQMFLDRNKDKLNILGIGDGDIQVGIQDGNDRNLDHESLYHIDSGIFTNKTLNFADAVCKTVDAAISLGADAVVGDFTNTAYQDSMFDGLDSKSNPTYGITVQIVKGGVFLRADIDAFGQCKILQGASGTEVIATIDHVFTDNTHEYQSALADALDVQVDEDMSTTDTHDSPKLAVGDKVVWRNKNGELRGIYRGEADGKAVLVVDGTQMSAPAGEVVADDQPAPKPVDDQVAESTESAAAKRISEIEQQINASDFDPMAADTDELIDLVDQVEGDAALTAKLEAISMTLQQKTVAISMKALADMAGA